MNLQTFSASTMAEALAAVKHRFGPDAMILHTRTIQRREWLGLRRRELIEVTAGPGGERPRRGNAPAARSQQSPSREQSSRDQQSRDPLSARNSGAAALGGTAGGGGANPALAAYARHSAMTAAAPRAATPAPTKSLFESPEMAQAMVKLVTQEVTGLREELKELVGQVRRGSTGAPAPAFAGGSELFEYYKQLIENQVASELAEDILKSVRLQIPPGYLTNQSFVRDKIAEQLEKLLPVAGPIRRTKTTGPHVVALIGPTGVGKTTTIAKLAANLQLREGRRVGLITIDTFRIAAVDQLRRYADIIGSPLKVVGTPEDMPAAIAGMSDCDYVLIDTAGRSPSDSMKLSELRSFLEAAKPDEVHLVLSTTSDHKCIDLAVAAFTKVRVDKILFTKIDEAANIGVILNVARKVGKALSYVTTGQDVPDDIEEVQARKVARMILGNPVSAPAPVPARSEPLSRTTATPRLVVAGGLQ